VNDLNQKMISRLLSWPLYIFKQGWMQSCNWLFTT